jgi:hypothetical protein
MITTAEIERLMIRERYARNLVLPRFTPPNWWECDIFEITKAGFFREYEIKVSRADFRADAKKAKEKWKGWEATDGGGHHAVYDVDAKHPALASHSTRGPSRFWYVTPQGLLKPEELPSFAGLIEFQETEYGIRQVEIVSAPKLHGEKITPDFRAHALTACYWRYLRALTGLSAEEFQKAVWK